jgi:hypothetical protein
MCVAVIIALNVLLLCQQFRDREAAPWAAPARRRLAVPAVLNFRRYMSG